MPYYHPLREVRDKKEQLWTIDKLLDLRNQLDMQIPGKTATETLLFATWNIREFENNRRTESFYYIAEILSWFDLITGIRKIQLFP